jgi:hypothetical protein
MAPGRAAALRHRYQMDLFGSRVRRYQTGASGKESVTKWDEKRITRTVFLRMRGSLFLCGGCARGLETNFLKCLLPWCLGGLIRFHRFAARRSRERLPGFAQKVVGGVAGVAWRRGGVGATAVRGAHGRPNGTHFDSATFGGVRRGSGVEPAAERPVAGRRLAVTPFGAEGLGRFCKPFWDTNGLQNRPTPSVPNAIQDGRMVCRAGPGNTPLAR